MSSSDAPKKPTVDDIPKAPDSFLQIICDLTADLTAVYPEYSLSWFKWTKENITNEELNLLFQYCMLFYPERFFDILYKNEDIFDNESANPVNTMFLPNVEFKALYNCEGVSQKTRDNIWKYLQLILFSVVQVMKDSSLFGKSVDMFQNVDADDLRSKLDEVVTNMTELFVNFENIANELSGKSDNKKESSTNDAAEDGVDDDDSDDDDEEGGEKFRPFTKFDAEKIHSHINNLLEGKIGSLAKELAEDVSREFNDEVRQMEEGAANGAAFDTKTLLSNMIKNPEKMCNLVKKIGGKLDEKMKSGEVSQEELMKEAADIMEKMKDIPGMRDMKSIIKQFGKGLGANMGKDMRVDTNAMNNMSKNQQMKEKLRARLEAKKRAQVEAAVAAAKQAAAAAMASTQEIDPSLLESEPIAQQPQKSAKSGKKKGKK